MNKPPGELLITKLIGNRPVTLKKVGMFSHLNIDQGKLETAVQELKNKFNNDQKAAADLLLNGARGGLGFIYGPPSCGKSFVWKMIIIILYKASSTTSLVRAMVLAPSNILVDVLAAEIYKELRKHRD